MIIRTCTDAHDVEICHNKGVIYPNLDQNTSLVSIISISAFFAKHFKDGKIVELWFLFDQLSMMQQLGLFPPKEKPDV